jgi:hypothetical protein
MDRDSASLVAVPDRGSGYFGPNPWIEAFLAFEFGFSRATTLCGRDVKIDTIFRAKFVSAIASPGSAEPRHKGSICTSPVFGRPPQS